MLFTSTYSSHELKSVKPHNLYKHLFSLPDNPYYFYDATVRPAETPTKGFSFFRRRSSSSSSTKSIKSPKSKTFNSATLGSDASMLMMGGSTVNTNRKGSFKSLLRSSPTPPLTYSQQMTAFGESRFSDDPYHSAREPPLPQRQQPSRLRLGSYNESHSYSENDDVFGPR